MITHKRWRVYGLLLLALLLAVSTALAQSGGGYDLTWNTLDGGGGAASGGSYSLSGVAGQPDAGAMSGGAYTLGGGFLSGAVVRFDVYLPIVGR